MSKGQEKMLCSRDKTGLSRTNTVYKGNEGTTLNRGVMHREDTWKMLNVLRKHMHL